MIDLINSFCLSLNKNIKLEVRNPDFLLIREKEILSVKNPSLGLKTLLFALSSKYLTSDFLFKEILKVENSFDPIYFYYFLIKLTQQNLMSYSLKEKNEIIFTLEPMVNSFVLDINLKLNKNIWSLSRFAYLRAVEGEWVIESPLAKARLFLKNQRCFALIMALNTPHTEKELNQLIPDLSPSIQKILLRILKAMEIISEMNPDGKSLEESDKFIPLWEFHDLLFHSRSRLGRHNYPYGGTFQFMDKIEIDPVIKPKTNFTSIQLPISSIEYIGETSLQKLLEIRRSVRKHGKFPITIIDLSKFLYHSAKITTSFPKEKNGKYAHTRRPYPGGGAMYELELYLCVQRCKDLNPGLYHYDPQNHALDLMDVSFSNVEPVIKKAGSYAGKDLNPDILIVITARFSRIYWKYQSMAYATILKNVGVLYQTFYLVATSLNLAPCAIGGGDSDAFATLAGLAYYAETSVGEFLLGSTPERNE